MDFYSTYCRPGFGVPKERISRPKMCFRVIKPKIIFHRVRDQFCFGSLSLFLFIFISTHFFCLFSIHFSSTFFWFPFHHFRFAFASHISRRGELNNFWNSIFLIVLPFSIRHLIAHSSIGGFSSPLPPNVEGDPWLGYRKEFIMLKRGDYG